jgi:pilus assembly protein CpaB
MRRPGTILLLAIFVGALAAAVVYRNLRAQRDALDAARRLGSQATVDIVIADESIPIGSKITANQVRLAPWPAGVEPEGAAKDIQAVVGSVARTTIAKNQPVVSAVLMTGAGLLPSIISDGMRAMSVKVDTVTGVSGFITPNSRVDVLIAGKPAEGSDGNDPEERSKLVLQNVRVLATGTTIEQVDEKPVEVPTVTLLLSPADAEKMTLAARYEPVRLALRNYNDEALVNTSGVVVDALFEVQHRPPPLPAALPPPAPRQRPAVPRYTVDVLLGEKLTQHTLF